MRKRFNRKVAKGAKREPRDLTAYIVRGSFVRGSCRWPSPVRDLLNSDGMLRARWYTVVLGWGLVSSCAGAGPATRPGGAFLQDCAVRGLEIVQLSKIASIKADSAKTQKFANDVLGRQATLNTRIKSVADHLGITLNVQIDPAQQQQIDQLSSQYGRRLDRDYLRQIIKLQSQLLKSAQAQTQGALSSVASRIIVSAKGMIADARSLAPKIGVSLDDDPAVASPKKNEDD